MSASDELTQRIRVPRTGVTGEKCQRVVGVPLALAAVVASGQGWTSHDVSSGDTLSGLAQRYGTDVATLAARNGVGDPDRIYSGRTLDVPAAAHRAAAAKQARHRRAGSALTYRVRAGDTVWDIARRSGVSVRDVLVANGLRASAIIRPGQVLTLPHGASRHLAATASASSRSTAAATGQRARTGKTRPVVHVVRAGDTVWEVALRHGVTVSAVLEANGLGPNAAIRPGRKLVLPGARTAARRSKASRAATTTRRGGAIAKPPANVPFRRYSGAVTSAAESNRAALGYRRAPTRAAARQLIRDAARRHRVDPSLALAIGKMESGFNQKQVSIANAIGIMQVIPSSGRWASQLVGRPLDLMVAEDNVEAGVALLRALLDAAPDERTAIAGYYQGLAGVRRNGMYPDTRRYVATVQALRAQFR